MPRVAIAATDGAALLQLAHWIRGYLPNGITFFEFQPSNGVTCDATQLKRDPVEQRYRMRECTGRPLIGTGDWSCRFVRDLSSRRTMSESRTGTRTTARRVESPLSTAKTERSRVAAQWPVDCL